MPRALRILGTGGSFAHAAAGIGKLPHVCRGRRVLLESAVVDADRRCKVNCDRVTYPPHPNTFTLSDEGRGGAQRSEDMMSGSEDTRIRVHSEGGEAEHASPPSADE